MGCCGKGGLTSKCCLCSQGSKDWYHWGEKRRICWACKSKQEKLIIEREKQNKRAKRLLAGIGE